MSGPPPALRVGIVGYGTSAAPGRRVSIGEVLANTV